MANKFERTNFGTGVLVGSGGNVTSNVSNAFGPFATGGEKGIVKTEGAKNELEINFKDVGPLYIVPKLPTNCLVTDVRGYNLTGTVSVATVGAVNIAAARDGTEATYVSVPLGGDVTVTGPTAGFVVITYRHLV